METISMNTVIEFKIKGSITRKALSDMYREELYGSEDDFLDLIDGWIQTGRAKVIEARLSAEEQMANAVAEELKAVHRGQSIAQDREEKLYHNQGNYGYYDKVGFPAKTLLDAQEMIQQLTKNFNLKQEQIGVEMQGQRVIVTIANCPIKTYSSIERAFGFKRASEAVSGLVDKTARTTVNMADMTLNNVAVPIAKTAVSTSAKVAKSLFGFGAKIAGITVGELTKATKQCVTEIKNDGYIAEAKGEVIDGIHSVRRAVGSTTTFGGGGIIMD